MKTTRLLSVIRQHRGDIAASVCGVNEVRHVRVVKSDLLKVLAHAADYEYDASVAGDGVLYIDRSQPEWIAKPREEWLQRSKP